MTPTAPRRGQFWPPILLVLMLACVVAFLVAWRRGRPTGPLARPAATELAPAAGTGRLTIEFLDVGQGDAALIRSPEGKYALVDAGPTNRVVQLLRARGVERLDLAVVTHHHADHYGGMLAVLKQFRPRVFLDAPSPHASAHYAAILRQVRDAGMTAIEPTDAPRRVKLGSVLLTILPQPPLDPRNENNNSIGIRVDFGDFSALLTGDSEVAERAWWERHAPSLCAAVSVLKLAHHGSRNGTDAAWLRLTRPGLAVASMGAHNEFGHPHPETIRRLAAADIPFERTDRRGTIAVVTDGQTWSEQDDRSAADPAAAADPAGDADAAATPASIRGRPLALGGAGAYIGRVVVADLHTRIAQTPGRHSPRRGGSAAGPSEDEQRWRIMRTRRRPHRPRPPMWSSSAAASPGSKRSRR